MSALVAILFVSDSIGTKILFNGDSNSARYLLSALPQSLSALFAISFSVLIIAIEFSASKYTPKVLHFLLESIFKDFQIVGIITFFILTIFLSFITLAHIDASGVSNEVRMLTSLSVALTAICFLLIVNLFRRVPKFFNPEDIIQNLKLKVSSERRWRENQQYVKILGDIIKKELIQRNTDVATEALVTLKEVAIFNFRNNREGLNEEALEQLYDISRASLEIDDVNMSIEVIQVINSICMATVNEDSKYLAAFKYLREIGILALDFSLGIVHTQLLLNVSRSFKDLISYAKEKERSVQALFAIIQFFILGSFYKSNHESIANHIMEDLMSVCSQREVEAAYNGVIQKKETLRPYFGGKDPEIAFTEFYSAMMSD
ncbi:MAG TPA: DUF2254 family protein [Candidatus Acidoferrales bacterium]|nr:DUF2254 family protein [Candidatus Acidoferrales bacterium]